MNPLYGFSGKRIKSIGVITLPVSFDTPKNSRTEYITFDVVNILYPYNAILGRGLLNTFEAALHLSYLCLKIPATLVVTSVFSSQQEARTIEKGFTSGHKNEHFLQEDPEHHNISASQCKAEAPAEHKKAIEAEDEFVGGP
jgi:hypothetical protein